MGMRGHIVAALLVLAPSHAAFSAAPTLKGRFGLAGSAGCLNSITVQGGVPVVPSGFSAALVPNGSSFENDLATEGVAVFNTDGTGSITATTVNNSFGNANPAANSDTFQLTFTYAIALDGSITVTPGSHTGTFTAGPRATQSFTVANEPPLVGHVGAGRKALTLAIQTPGVETITYSNADAHDRVCHRAYSLVFLGR